MSALDALGLGVLVAYLALPLLALTARGPEASPGSRHRQLVAVLALDVALFAVPLLVSRLPAAHGEGAPALGHSTLAVLRWAAPPHGHGPLFWLGAAWLALTALGALHAGSRLARLGALLRAARVADEPACLEAWQLARALGLPPPRLVESDQIGVPFAWSLWRPAIALPPGLREQLSPEAFRCVLRHELEHLARGDQGWALAVALMRLPLALHPTAHALVREIGLAREEAVDEAAALEDPATYARALLDVAALAKPGPRLSEAVSMSATALSRRIRMLTEKPRRTAAKLWPTLAAALALTGVAGYAPRVAAQAASETASVSVLVKVGQKAVIHMADYGKPTRLAIGDPAICDVAPLSDFDIQLTGVSPGKTTLLLWTADNTRRAFLVQVQ